MYGNIKIRISFCRTSLHPQTVPVLCVLLSGTKVEEVQIMPGKDTRSEDYKKQGPIFAVPRLEDTVCVCVP